MRTKKCLATAVVFLAALCLVPPGVRAQQPSVSAISQAVAKISARESEEMNAIRQYSPLVETYIQKVKVNSDEVWAPDGDHYFIGRAEFANGFGVRSIEPRDAGAFDRLAANVSRVLQFGPQFLPQGFLQMIYADEHGLDGANYKFEYVRQEFLGEVRTLVFDVTPAKKSKGRFVGRIWAEDRNFTIVRFNGAYSGGDERYRGFHFDSWRVNAGSNLWLPAFIYSEENVVKSPKRAPSFKAQTRLWGYNAGRAGQEEELSRVLVESATPVKDEARQEHDLSPIQEARAWEGQAAGNIVDKLQRIGLIAPRGEVDKVLDTVVNNLEVTNNIELDPEVDCRVLMTSTLESFAVGHTIVLSRGLIDVLPDEASLAAILAEELSRLMLGPQVNTQYAFYDRLMNFDEAQTFSHFDFAHTAAEDRAASAKALELLRNSPYKDQLAAAGMFMAELQRRAQKIPNLISPRLGNAVLASQVVAADSEAKPARNQIVALPLGSRVKVDPWSDDLAMLKAAPAGSVSEREELSFEVTPFMLYLTRQESGAAKVTSTRKPGKDTNSR
jgi:hypothetical protein